MSLEWCPQCQRLRNMNVSTNIEEEMSDNGEVIMIKVSTYTCMHCSLFIRSEEDRVLENVTSV